MKRKFKVFLKQKFGNVRIELAVMSAFVGLAFLAAFFSTIEHF